MKSQTTLIIGGCRSGKSRHALKLAQQVPGGRKIYIATCVPLDEEMRRRVRRHQAERGPDWQTVEAPIDIEGSIKAHVRSAGVILVDCLTLWISNMMGQGDDPDAIVDAAKTLGSCIQTIPVPIILVSNEVGSGIVPENAMARQYRDVAGLVNQSLAAACSRVIWTAAGIPLTIK